MDHKTYHVQIYSEPAICDHTENKRLSSYPLTSIARRCNVNVVLVLKEMRRV